MEGKSADAENAQIVVTAESAVPSQHPSPDCGEVDADASAVTGNAVYSLHESVAESLDMSSNAPHEQSLQDARGKEVVHSSETMGANTLPVLHNGKHAPDTPKPTSTSTDAPKPTPSQRGKSLVAGLLASNKTMKPFRSPVIGRSSASSSSSSSSKPSTNVGETPTRPTGLSKSSGSTRPLITPLRSTASNSAAGNRALNKPFVSPMVSKTKPSSPERVDAEAGATEIPISSFQLNNALPVLERRLANLKNAKRYLKAIEQESDTSDNTERIRELSLKWLNAGRDAAEMLYAQTKDQIAEQVALDPYGTSRSAFGDEKQSKSWGWAAPQDNGKEQFKRAMREELENMSDKDREEALDRMEEEDERDPLPKDAAEILSRSTSRTSSSASVTAGMKRKLSNTSKTSSVSRTSSTSGTNESQDRVKKVARLEQVSENSKSDSQDSHSRRIEVDENDYAEVEEDEDVRDDPMNRGMAKMFIQCGINPRILGWNAEKEDWDPIEDQ